MDDEYKNEVDKHFVQKSMNLDWLTAFYVDKLMRSHFKIPVLYSK